MNSLARIMSVYLAMEAGKKSPQSFSQPFLPFSCATGFGSLSYILFRLGNSWALSGGRGMTTYLVKHNIVGAAEWPTPVLKNLADGVDLQGLSADWEPIMQPTHTDLLPNLLIDNNVD